MQCSGVFEPFFKDFQLCAKLGVSEVLNITGAGVSVQAVRAAG